MDNNNNIPTFSFYRSDNAPIEFEIIEKTGNDINYTRQFSAHRHEFIEIIWVTKYTTTQIVDYKMYEIKANEVLIIPENCTHYEKNQPYEGFVFLFTSVFFNSEQAQLLQGFSVMDILNQNRLLKIEDNTHTITLLQALIQAYRCPAFPFSILSLQSLLFAVLINLENISKIQNKEILIETVQSKIYRDFILLLEENYRKQTTAIFYAQQIGISLKKLNATLTTIINKTAGESILERIILEAKRYLSYSNKPIKEIAFELGFEDNYYFSRIFKKKTTYTPKEFRKKFALKSI